MLSLYFNANSSTDLTFLHCTEKYNGWNGLIVVQVQDSNSEFLSSYSTLPQTYLFLLCHMDNDILYHTIIHDEFVPPCYPAQVNVIFLLHTTKHANL